MGGKVVQRWQGFELPTLAALVNKNICTNKKIISLWLRLESTTSVVQLIHIGVKIRKVRGYASDFFFGNIVRILLFKPLRSPNFHPF